jgi:hypothetical protein
MICIRECVTPEDIKAIRIQHLNFVSSVVVRRLDFYIALFTYIQYLQTHPRTQLVTIQRKMTSYNTIVHHTQVIPFTKLIFSTPNAFDDTRFNDLKNLGLLQLQAQNLAVVLEKLNSLKARHKTIIDLDLSSGSIIAKNYYREMKVEFEPIKFLLNKIFDYEDWFLKIEPSSPWGPYQLTKALGLKVCCYCNRQYTFTLSKGPRKITRPELDHFLPKSKNPLLALSFFNLIPSCTVCNRDCKGKKDFNYVNYLSPYEKNEKHGYISYDYFPTSYLGSIGESDDIKVFIKTSGVASDPLIDAKIKGNVKIFEYNTIINEHKDIVQDIIRKRHMSNDNYIETLQKTFPAAHLTLDEAYRLAYGNFHDEKEFSKRPLAKLTKDIAVGVGSLKKHN